MKRYIPIAVFMALAVSVSAEPPRVISYVNGVFNTNTESKYSLDLIMMSYRLRYEGTLSKSEFEQKYAKHLFYNETGCLEGNCTLDILEAGVQQGVFSDVKDFWEFWDKITWIGHAEPLDEAAQQYLGQIIEQIQQTVDIHTESFVEEIESFTGAGMKVAVVMHSQGNFFGNSTWEALGANAKALTFPIGVATPDSYVANSGEHSTVDCDFIHLIPGALSANVPSISCPVYLCSAVCHSFSTYITGAVSSGVTKTRILDHVKDAFVPTIPLESLVANGSFSEGLTGWSRTGDFWAGTELSNYYSPPGYAAGGVDINGYHKNGASGTLSQVVTIPVDAGTQAMLQLWINVSSDDAAPGARDFFRLEIYDPDTGALLGTPISLSNANASYVGDYTGYGINLSAYIGRALRIKFVATSDLAFPTVFRIDNVSLVVQ